MNAIFPRFLRTAYRKEPISSFILIVGAVDAAIGGAGQRWTLLSFGVTVILLSVVLRWWQLQKVQAVVSQEPPRRYLPPSSSPTPLPMLTHERHRR